MIPTGLSNVTSLTITSTRSTIFRGFGLLQTARKCTSDVQTDCKVDAAALVKKIVELVHVEGIVLIV